MIIVSTNISSYFTLRNIHITLLPLTLITVLLMEIPCKAVLVHAKVQYPAKPKPIQTSPVAHNFPYSTAKCRYCPQINTSGWITSTMTQRKYSTKIRVDCKSSDLIYCITCNVCKLQHIGQTKRQLMDRFQGHFWGRIHQTLSQ